MLVVDTNVLVYAADAGSPFHRPCRAWLERQRRLAGAWYSTWAILYEFLRVTTHPRVMRHPWSVQHAWGFVAAVLAHLASAFWSRPNDMRAWPTRFSGSCRTLLAISSTTPTRPF